MKESDCPNKDLHHPYTGSFGDDYLKALAWFNVMCQTHVQEKCPGCGLWVVWKRKGKPMEVGDRVQTVKEWNDEYCQDGLRGTILKIPLHGPVHKERNHYVLLDKGYREWSRLWFRPDDLEPEGS